MVFFTILPPSISNLVLTTALHYNTNFDNEIFGDGKKIKKFPFFHFIKMYLTSFEAKANDSDFQSQGW